MCCAACCAGPPVMAACWASIDPFLYQVCETVIAENASAYPELVEKKDYIIKVLKVEEERFAKTIDQGMEILNSIMDKISADQINQAVFSGEDAFRLYDTFGFPIDLTKEILAERGLPIDEEGFFRLMGEQKKRARDARKDVSGWDTDEMLDVEGKVKFIGYEKTRSQGKILALLDEDGKPVDCPDRRDESHRRSGFHPLLRRKRRAGGRQRRNRPRQIHFPGQRL